MDDRYERMHYVTMRDPTFVLIPGAGGSSFTFHRLVSELERATDGRSQSICPPATTGPGSTPMPMRWWRRSGTGCVRCWWRPRWRASRRRASARASPVELVVLLNAMIPQPGETAGAWWEATGQAEARAEQAARTGGC